MVVNLYGLTLSFAVLLGVFVARREAKARRLDLKLFDGALLPVLFFGLLGARLYHVLSFAGYYRQDLARVVFFGSGGLAVYGGIIGGFLGLAAFLFFRRGGIRGLEGIGNLLDAAAFGLPVAQAVGRFGNFFNRELYGWPTNLPWGIYIPPENRFSGLSGFAYFHPLFLYEAILDIAIFALLLAISQRRRKDFLPGEMFLFYLAFYGLGRFFLEGMRIDTWMVDGTRVAQLLSALLFSASIALLVARRAIGSQETRLEV